MAFTGKATYLNNNTIPNLGEDLADIVDIISPYETPLLDALGDPLRAALSINHEWLEDELLPNKDVVVSYVNPELKVAHSSYFRTGDQIQVEGSSELILVTDVHSDHLPIARGYAGTNQEDLKPGQIINILGNTGEGSDKPPRFTKRTRYSNHTQIFTGSVEVTLDDLATSQLGLSDEMDYQKQEKLRELLRELENTVINGSYDEGQMKGIIHQIKSNCDKYSNAELSEELISEILKSVWETSNGNINLIVCSGFQKRKLDIVLGLEFPASNPHLYESDFGVIEVAVSRWMPQDAVLLLDSSRINILPLAGRSFHFKPLTSSEDYECGELVGEYTLELKNEAAHGIIRGLSIV